MDLQRGIDEIASATNFSGVVRVDRGDDTLVVRAYGLADRAHGVPNTVATRFGLASGTKGLTALTVMRLVDMGVLNLATTARSLLGDDLPSIDDRVTVEHLLGHRSGIGDYLDEDSGITLTDYVMPVPVHTLVATEDYVGVLGGQPAKFAPGESFTYCNGGYVVLALLAERATKVPFHDLVDQHVCRPAGLVDTAFLRSDELPGDAAIGYLTPGLPRTNVLHLPVRGSGDGGVYSTAADVHALWRSLFAGRIVSPAGLAEMVRPRSDPPDDPRRYGLGFWLHATSATVMLHGYDAGVSFRTSHDPVSDVTHTVLCNSSRGATPVAAYLDEALS